jgi:hypothetical protein
LDRWLQLFAQANFLRSADTAHDLKTPLNVAVLNLELLRMRVRKLTEANDDPKLIEYAQAIDVELRRMARIFDTFFLLSTPPKGEGSPPLVDVAGIFRDAASTAGYSWNPEASANVYAHEGRIRQAFKLFFEGAAKTLKSAGRRLSVELIGQRFTAVLEGSPEGADFELTRIFKFYYTDPNGNPDVSLAAARLIAETYGGELYASEESDKVWLRFSLPLGEG